MCKKIIFQANTKIIISSCHNRDNSIVCRFDAWLHSFGSKIEEIRFTFDHHYITVSAYLSLNNFLL